MHERVIIRPAKTARDALAMRRVRNSCREFMTRDTSRKTIVGQLMWWWFHRPDTLHPFVVETSNGIIGYAILSHIDDRGWLTAGLLSPDRGHGIGTTVFRWLAKRAESMGLRPCLEVRVSNKRAHKVYRSIGFINIILRGDIMEMEKRWQ